jgi:hypothetical protein
MTRGPEGNLRASVKSSMDYKHSTLALAAALVATVIAGGWYVSRLEGRMTAMESESRTQAPVAAPVLPGLTATLPGSAPPAASVAPGIESTIVAPDSFDRAYRAAGLIPTAEKQCWATTNASPDAFVHFDLRVATDGTVKTATSVPTRGPSTDAKLMDCLKRLVLQLRFPAASDDRESRVQVSRR